LADVLAEEARQHPDQPVEVWTTDEHRLGLKPVRRRVWAPIGEQPIALGHHRDKWLYVTAFVQPAGGETIWSRIPRMTGILLARSSEICADFQRLAASSVAAP
jgi:hypothetical protein